MERKRRREAVSVLWRCGTPTLCSLCYGLVIVYCVTGLVSPTRSVHCVSGAGDAATNVHCVWVCGTPTVYSLPYGRVRVHYVSGSRIYSWCYGVVTPREERSQFLGVRGARRVLVCSCIVVRYSQIQVFILCKFLVNKLRTRKSCVFCPQPGLITPDRHL